MLPVLFALVIFWIGACIFAQASLNYILSVYASCVAGVAVICHNAQLTSSDAKLSFCPKIAGIGHCAQPLINVKKKFGSS
jgi:hypothetical protein